MTFQYTARQLLDAAMWAKTHPEQRVTIHIQDWFSTELTGAQWRQWFRNCLDRKINRATGHAGRKWETDWQTEMHRASRQLNTPRLALHWLPHELKERFAHRLAERG